MQIISKIKPLRMYATDVMDIRGSSLTRGNLYIIWEKTLEGWITSLENLNKDRAIYRDWETDRKSTRLNSSHITRSRMPSSA